jgi:hypothetical protein
MSQEDIARGSVTPATVSDLVIAGCSNPETHYGHKRYQ